MITKKINNDLYICRTPPGSSNRCGRREKKVRREWFLIKQQKRSGYVSIGNVCLPKELIGKRIRLKIEVLSNHH